MADTLLKVDGINVYYGNIHAVKDISFTVNAGEIVTLIGANGAGKSTTLKTISGLLKPRTGDVLYKGKSIKGVRAHKIVESGLAQVPEGRHVFLHMTVDENLDMGAYTQPASTIAANKEKVFTLFPRLKERRKQLAGTMSGGEQQMLAMGRALMSNASMLMLDEPSMGLSPLLVQEIFDIIQNIHKGDNIKQKYEELEDKAELILHKMERPVSLSKDRFTPAKAEVTSNLTKEQYEANVKKAKEYIKNGDIFQVVLSQRFEVETDVDPFDVYRCLRTSNPSPYLYFFDFIDYQVVGASPENLVIVLNGIVATKPIAGTVPR